jgi:hypothetical protein
MKHNKFLLAAGLVMALAALMVSPALAGSAPVTHSVTITSVNCSTGQVTVSITINGSPSTSHTVTITNSSTGTSTTPHTVTHSSGSFTETVSGTLASISGGDTIKVTSASGPYSMTATTTAACDDGRLNWYVWSTAVIYCSDADGITIYQASKEGKIGQVFNVTAAELAALPAKPASNTLIKKVGTVALYKLTSGEYQLNVGPDSEGKTQVLIWRNCNRNSLYQYTLQASSHAPYALMGGRIAL